MSRRTAPKSHLHKAEPWRVEPLQADHGASIALVTADAMVAAIIPPLNEEDGPDMETAKRDPHDEANARRIVAAINACAGIPTEALESGIIKDLIEFSNSAAWYIPKEAHSLQVSNAHIKGKLNPPVMPQREPDKGGKIPVDFEGTRIRTGDRVEIISGAYNLGAKATVTGFSHEKGSVFAVVNYDQSVNFPYLKKIACQDLRIRTD